MSVRIYFHDGDQAKQVYPASLEPHHTSVAALKKAASEPSVICHFAELQPAGSGCEIKAESYPALKIKVPYIPSDTFYERVAQQAATWIGVKGEEVILLVESRSSHPQ